MVIADPDPWSVSLRMLVEQAQAAGGAVTSANGPFIVDGLTLEPAGDGRSWLIESGAASVSVVAPETGWSSLPSFINGAIFVSGGPADWQGRGQGFSVIQVASNSRAGLPVRSVLQTLLGAPLYRTDRLGTVELVELTAGFNARLTEGGGGPPRFELHSSPRRRLRSVRRNAD